CGSAPRTRRARSSGRLPAKSSLGVSRGCVFAAVQPEVDGGLDQDQNDDRAERAADRQAHERAEEDREVEDQEAPVRREHLLRRRDLQVLAPVQGERRRAADPEADRSERDSAEVGPDWKKTTWPPFVKATPAGVMRGPAVPVSGAAASSIF